MRRSAGSTSRTRLNRSRAAVAQLSIFTPMKKRPVSGSCSARISVLDHAVLYGDGVFETACAWNGRIFKLGAHLDRCFRSMAAIALEPPVSRDGMHDLIVEAVRLNGFRNAYVKWIVTRGVN